MSKTLIVVAVLGVLGYMLLKQQQMATQLPPVSGTSSTGGSQSNAAGDAFTNILGIINGIVNAATRTTAQTSAKTV